MAKSQKGQLLENRKLLDFPHLRFHAYCHLPNVRDGVLLGLARCNNILVTKFHLKGDSNVNHLLSASHNCLYNKFEIFDQAEK